MFGCVCLCISSHWLLGRASQVSVCKHNRVSLIVPGSSSCPWEGFQFGTVIGWPFPQTLLYLCPCTSCRQDTFWVEVSVNEFLSLSLYWEFFLAAGCDHFRFHIPLLLGLSARVAHINPMGLSSSPVSSTS